MKPIIETERCYLRELSPNDAENFYMLNADKDVIQYTGDQACLEYGFNQLQLTKIVGRAMVLNSASIKVLEKVGMVLVGHFEFHLHDGVLYQIEK